MPPKREGNTDGDYAHSSVTATNLDANAWWQVDLGVSASVTSIVVWNRTDCHQTVQPTPGTTVSAGAQGRYVRVQLSGCNYLSLAGGPKSSVSDSRSRCWSQGPPLSLHPGIR